MGLRYAKSSNEEVCSPKVFEAASIDTPRISAIKSRLIMDLSKGNKKRYNGAIMT
jgi:hypothetical protein